MSPTSEPDLDLLSSAYGQYERGNYAEAIRGFESLIAQGSTLAPVYLGYIYECGLGVPKDLSKALELFMRSAEAGSAEGQYYLASLYEQGNQLSEARAWYLKAAAQIDTSREVIDSRSPVAQGAVLACVALGNMYYRGVAVEADLHTAQDYYLKAAKAGSVEAQFHLATLYRARHAFSEAILWHTRASEHLQANTNSDASASQWAISACVQLGYMYQRGIGTAVDLTTARELYLRAAQAGSVEGQYYLATLFEQTNQLDQALFWFEKAAAQSHASAQYRAYLMYRDGQGTAPDNNRAQAYLLGAMKLGHVYAQRARAVQLIRGFEGIGGILRGLGMLVTLWPRAFKIAYEDSHSPLLH